MPLSRTPGREQATCPEEASLEAQRRELNEMRSLLADQMAQLQVQQQQLAAQQEGLALQQEAFLEQQRLRQQQQSPPIADEDDHPTPPVQNHGANSTYYVTLYKDALDAIPEYDGQNLDFICFAEGCEEALDMIPHQYEENFVKSLRNKLKGDARRSIIGTRFNRVSALVEHLRSIYAPHETVYEALGKLANVFQKSDEEVITFANRVRELGKRILDAFKREYNSISPTFLDNTDENLKRCFLRGLKSEISVRMPSMHHNSLNELITKAIVIQKENDAISQMRSLSEGKSDRRVANETVHKVQSETITCQLCNKSGHDATRCWTYNPNFSRNHNNKPSSSTSSSTQPNIQQIVQAVLQAQIQNRTVNRDSGPKDQKFCRYCKKLGHEIEECRKRAYNNSRPNSSFDSRNGQGRAGNAQEAAGTSAPRSNLPARSIHPIAAESVELETQE
ncbi:hypothetical protein ANTPLA_LOCUS7601 [Anthophora plagiata]